MRTSHLQILLEIIKEDMKRRCEHSFYEELRDKWSDYHSDIHEIIKDMKSGLK